MKLCECGCGKPTTVPRTNDASHGRVRGRPLRYLRSHHPARHAARWERAVDIQPNGGCWLWRGCCDQLGYGHLVIGGLNQPAHRWFYEAFVGPIPDGLEIDHLCRVKSCVNPSHLEAVTRTQNIRRSHRTKLTLTQAREIRNSDERTVVLAERYGVCASNICKIRNGEYWKEEAV